jgi:serine phosphatase RsbU (regulator of sigma subunit)
MDMDDGHSRSDPRGEHGDALLDTVVSLGSEVLVEALAAAPVGMGLLDVELRWVYANPAFLRTTGLEPAHILRQPVAATPFAADLPTINQVLLDGAGLGSRPEPGHAATATATTATATATGWEVRYRRLEIDGRVVGVIASVLGPATPDQRQLAQARRRLAMQKAAAERIGTTLDVDITCVELAELTVPAMADLTVVEVMPYEIADRGAGGGLQPEAPRVRRAALACAPDLRRRLGTLAMPGASVRPGADSAVARSLAEGRPVVANLLSDEELADWAETPEMLAAYRLAGVDSILAVPLSARGRLVGVMTLARSSGNRGRRHDRGASEGFTEDDAILIQDLADRAAVSVENARQYAESQSVTLELQRALLVEPGRPHSNLDVAARYLPSGNRTLVGGDWYEIVRLPFGRTLLVMGDVMGHGLEAAVDMSIYRSAIRDAGGMDLPPHGILRHLDTLISRDETARPATCLLGVADPNRGRWTFASAGHLPPALFVPGRPTELVKIPTGPPLGTGIGGYEQVIVDLRADQVLLIYTDGLVERRGEDIDVSLARLASLPLPASGGLEDLLDDALRLVAPAAVEDDIAILAARAMPR